MPSLRDLCLKKVTDPLDRLSAKMAALRQELQALKTAEDKETQEALVDSQIHPIFVAPTAAAEQPKISFETIFLNDDLSLDEKRTQTQELLQGPVSLEELKEALYGAIELNSPDILQALLQHKTAEELPLSILDVLLSYASKKASEGVQSFLCEAMRQKLAKQIETATTTDELQHAIATLETYASGLSDMAIEMLGKKLEQQVENLIDETTTTDALGYLLYVARRMNAQELQSRISQKLEQFTPVNSPDQPLAPASTPPHPQKPSPRNVPFLSINTVLAISCVALAALAGLPFLF